MARVKWDRKFVETTLVPKMRDAFVEYGRELTAGVRSSLSTPFPPPSAPGRPPHRRTGRLRSSIRSVVFVTPKSVTLQTGSDLDYSLFTELGTARMAPRPYLRPAVRRTVPRLNAQLRKIDRRLPRVSVGFRSAVAR